jgi:AcrR family transcriptional regulator
MTQTRREKLRDATREEIMSTAWKQIGEVGASGLSLRGIAREMGVTAPALYRYYKDRDALVTALLMDAFGSFTSALEAGRDSRKADDHAGRFSAMGKAYFQWGVSNPQRYMLLFGTPIRGYMFAEELGPVAQRSFLVLQGVIGETHAAGKIVGEVTAVRLPTKLKAQYEALSRMGMPYGPLVTHLALSVWSSIHGITSLYLYNYLNGFLGEQMETFVDVELAKISHMLGLE